MTGPAPRRARPQVPERLARRPWDEKRNVPVPVFNEHDRGAETVVDFTTVYWPRIVECAEKRLCCLCGEPLDYYVAFLGGPLSFESRCYIDGPMHEDCLVAATALCPHIAIPHAGRASDSRLAPGTTTTPGMSLNKPGVWIMGVTRDFKVVYSSPHGPHIKAAPWRRSRRFVYEDFRLVEQT